MGILSHFQYPCICFSRFPMVTSQRKIVRGPETSSLENSKRVEPKRFSEKPNENEAFVQNERKRLRDVTSGVIYGFEGWPQEPEHTRMKASWTRQLMPITAVIRYTPTTELNHSQLLQLHELKLPAIEDLSWEHVVSSSCVKLRNYAKVYEARAEGLRMPRSRQETDIFFTALLHARREASSMVANVAKECAERAVHEDVIELVLEKDVALRCAERYGTDEVACVARFMSGENVKWTDEIAVQSAVGIAEELAEVALNRAQRANGERVTVCDMEGVMETLQLGEPWKGWCGMRGGIRNRRM